MFHHFESLNVRKLMMKWQYERRGRVCTWKVKCRNGCVLLPLNVTLYRLLSFNNQHTDTDGKQNINLGRVSRVLQGISVVHRVNSPGWPQLYRLDWWLLCCWPEDRILSIMWGNLGPSAVWSPCSVSRNVRAGTFLSHFILNRVIPRPT